jgi:hypothetical protein
MPASPPHVSAYPVSNRVELGDVCRAHLENSIASTSIYVLQVIKSQRRMPWRLKPMKDVGGCDKPRGVAYQAWIRGRPNGETRHPSWGVTLV